MTLLAQLELGFFWDSSGRENLFIETCIASVGLCFHFSPWALEREQSNNACAPEQTNKCVCRQKPGDLQLVKHRRGQTQWWWPPAAPEQTNKYVCRHKPGWLTINKTQKGYGYVMDLPMEMSLAFGSLWFTLGYPGAIYDGAIYNTRGHQRWPLLGPMLEGHSGLMYNCHLCLQTKTWVTYNQ